MTDFLTTIQSRRSIRKFNNEPVKKEELSAVLEAVKCSQSWNNSQCWELVIVTNPEIRKELQQTVPSSNPGFTAIVDSPVLIAMGAKTKMSGYINNEAGSALGDWFMHDVGIATQNLCNQAHSIGLGTVVVAWMDQKKAQKIIELPDGYRLVSLIPLGHPGQNGSTPTRKETNDFVHYDKFGSGS